MESKDSNHVCWAHGLRGVIPPSFSSELLTVVECVADLLAKCEIVVIQSVVDDRVELLQIDLAVGEYGFVDAEIDDLPDAFAA